MEILGNNKILQRFLGITPLFLYLILLIFMLSDFAMFYGTAYKNSEIVKTDKKIVEVVSWEQDNDNVDKTKLLDSDGNEKVVDTPELSLVLDSLLGNKHLAYYSEDSNMLMQPIDVDYVEEFILSYNVELMAVVMMTGVLLMLIAMLSKKFSELSKKRYFILHLSFFIVSALVVMMFFWMVS